MYFSLMTQIPNNFSRWMVVVFSLLMFMVSALPTMAQDVEFRPLMAANDLTCLMEVGDKVFGGLNGGGLMVWDRADPTVSEVWNSSAQLSGNNITDLSYVGNHLWVATLDAGVTRIENPDSNPEFRQFSGNLGSKRITAVTAAMVAGSEQVYYAMDGEGVGGISDGLPGFVFSTLDGLLSDDCNALQIFEGELFVATDLGISRFRNNVFTTQNDGLTSVLVNDLTLDAQGNLLAGGAGGVFRWDNLAETWISLGWTGGAIVDLSARDGEVYAIGNNVLGLYNGSAWTTPDLPQPNLLKVSAGSDLWIGGRTHDAAMANSSFLVYLARMDTGNTFTVWDVDASLVRNAYGVALGLDGDAWIGSREANAVSRFDGENYVHFFEVGDADNNFSGLFDFDGNMLAMASDPEGNIWVGQFGRGALIINPDNGVIRQVHHNVTGMVGGRLLNMVAHPDGTMLFLHDRGEDALVDVLVDPENFTDDNNWLSLPRELPGLGNGLDVYDALVERNDVIWFAVGDVGLVRWDINGDNLGPDDEITWLDTSDDHWYSAVTSLPFSNSDPKAATGLALAPDGTIWAGGNGVARFSYNENLGVVTRTEETWGQKSSAFGTGLVSGEVTDISVDLNGDLWVATTLGLNRVRTVAGETTIDVYMDVENYLSDSSFGILYSTNAIVPLPGGTYRDMAVSQDGATLLVSSDRGAGLINVSPATSGQSGASLSGLYCYPNPYVLEEADGGLKLGGLTSNSQNSLAAVEIFNLEGQMVYANSSVSPGESFWYGVNRIGEPAVTGMYVVKVVWENLTAVCGLAVVR